MRGICSVLLVWVIISGFLASAALGREFSPPDYKKIQELTTNPSLPTFYNKLLPRFAAHDTTLTLEETYLLYFGSMFVADTTTDSVMVYKDSIRLVFQQKEIALADRACLATYYSAMLKAHPLNLGYLLNLNYQYKTLGDSNYAATHNMLLLLARAIISTGDGRTPASAYHVATLADELALLDMLGLPNNGVINHTNTTDFILLGRNEANIEAIYFNTTQMLQPPGQPYTPPATINPPLFPMQISNSGSRKKR